MAQIVVDQVAPGAVASKVTAYVGDLEVTDGDGVQNSTALTATRYLTFGGATVATVTSAASGTPSWSLLLGDGQGSAQVAMELKPVASGTGLEDGGSTHAVTRNAYLPFGATRGGDNLATSRGWLGQVADTDTGLIYLNARYYDPVLSRFVSPDPLMNPGDPKTLDPYRYADNNPVMMTDASGLEPRVWEDGRVVGAPASSKTEGNPATPKPGRDRLHGHGRVDPYAEPPMDGNDDYLDVLDEIFASGATVGKPEGTGIPCSNIACVTHQYPGGPCEPGEFANCWVYQGVPDPVPTTLEEWWTEFGDELLLGAGIVAGGICVAVTLGTCAILTFGVAAFTIWDGKAYRGWTNDEAIGYGVVTVLTFGIAGGATSTMVYRGMSDEALELAFNYAARYNLEVYEVSRTGYVMTAVNTNLPGAGFGYMGFNE